MIDDYRVVTVADGMENKEPLALAFDAVFQIIGMLDDNMALPLLANVIAFGLRNRTNQQRVDALETLAEMVMECVQANEDRDGGTKH